MSSKLQIPNNRINCFMLTVTWRRRVYFGNRSLFVLELCSEVLDLIWKFQVAYRTISNTFILLSRIRHYYWYSQEPIIVFDFFLSHRQNCDLYILLTNWSKAWTTLHFFARIWFQDVSSRSCRHQPCVRSAALRSTLPQDHRWSLTLRAFDIHWKRTSYRVEKSHPCSSWVWRSDWIIGCNYTN